MHGFLEDFFVPDYLNLAMSYAPPSNEKLRYELLCMRSDSFRQQEKYQEAIDDAKSATNIKPKELEVRLVQLFKLLSVFAEEGYVHR